ncbi:MAG: hypothetical protein HYU66_01795 [Armatimonadetes bacterium]|nr:hypothetical protein [Armatimonadota bacterium]
MSRRLCVAALGLACLCARAADKLLPWQRWIEEPTAEQSRDLESLSQLPWKSTGGQEGTLRILDEPGPWGGKRFEFTVKIDHHNEGAYPQGWPAFEVQPNPKLDFSGFDAVTYWIRCDTKVERGLPIRFILWSGGEGRINEQIAALKPGEWKQVTQSLRGVPALDQVDRLHFFLSESEYHHGDELVFQIGGFQLVKLHRVLSKLPADAAACGLWVGERGDTGDQAVIVEQGARELPILLVCETGAKMNLSVEDQVRYRFHDVFSGRETVRTANLGGDLPPGGTHRFTDFVDVSALGPGYYLVTADVQREGKSLLGGRVGCDDLYVKRPGESMTYTVLSIRTGMCEWVRDQLHGDIMCDTRIALPHVYDPLDKGTYAQFIDLHGLATGKHTEGNEAGDTGLALAAEAFRKSGDPVRTAYTERLLLESCDSMIQHMQAPSGGAITWVNQLFDEGIGKGGGSQAFGGYDTNQMGEWMRAITYAILYCAQVPERRVDAVRLSAAVRRTADYLMAHGAQDADGLPSVLRHLHLSEKGDGSVAQQTYHQEGRQCDVYLGRALAGASYYAYAMQVLGDKVPDAWWPIFDNTVTWCDRKMKPNGWFDWQCEDVVEGGCHTFLGNIYIGEGLYGVCLADRLAGREGPAQAAATAAKRAYRYVTDDCYIKGRKFTYPLEFWVGPYVYWLFTEWLDTVGPDEKMTGWLTVLDRRWSVERGWHDFLDRAPAGGCGRTESNGMLAVSILGYLGIKQMQEVGKPLHWRIK